jgi:hypothetical protein
MNDLAVDCTHHRENIPWKLGFSGNLETPSTAVGCTMCDPDTTQFTQHILQNSARSACPTFAEQPLCIFSSGDLAPNGRFELLAELRKGDLILCKEIEVLQPYKIWNVCARSTAVVVLVGLWSSSRRSMSMAEAITSSWLEPDARHRQIRFQFQHSISTSRSHFSWICK